jgi:glucokinase
MSQYLIGFDLGGTKMLAALIQGNKVIHRVKNKTKSQNGPRKIVQDIIGTIHTLINETRIETKDLLGIGMSVPGVLNRKKGIVVEAPNLGMKDFPLEGELSKEFGKPVILENDVNAGVYGEFINGAAKGYEHVLGVFPGTGIGGGLIIDGKLYRGSSGNAGEFGHMTIQNGGALCGCGQRGHIEAIASRTAMGQEAVGLIAGGKLPHSLAHYGTDIKKISSKFFAQALKEKNSHVMEIIDTAAENLGVAIASAINLLDPELVLIGGGLVEKLGDFYLKRIEDSMRRRAMAGIVAKTDIKAAELGDDAVFFGAAQLLLDKLEKRD